MKCRSCNCHFEGKVCPNCGTRNNVTQNINNKQTNSVEVTTTHKFVLLGFRSNKLWKKIVSIVYLLYCLMLLVGILMQVRPPALPTRDYQVNILEYIFMMLIFISPYIFLSDSPLRKCLRKIRGKLISGDMIAWLVVLTLLFIGFNELDALHTPAYFADQENHDYVLTETKHASCEENGMYHYQCNFCGEEDEQIISPLGHDMKVLSENSDGSVVYICSRCGKMETVVP